MAAVRSSGLGGGLRGILRCMTSDRLAELRSTLQQVDLEILRLTADRLRLAHEIGRAKIERGLPVRDYRMETEILARTTRRCLEMGVDPRLGTEIVSALMRGAVRVQEDLRERVYGGASQQVLVVGGRGKMGAWLARYFNAQGHRVSIFDPAGSLDGFASTRSLEEGCETAEVVVLAVPLSESAAVYESVLAATGDRPDLLIADIFSVKSQIIAAARRAASAGRRVVSLHPMFGPTVYLLSGRTMLVCGCGCPEASADARRLFEGTSLSLVELPIEDHDALIAPILGLSHLVNLLFAGALREGGLSHGDLRRISSTTFERQSESAREVCQENPELYFDIQRMNPFSVRIYEHVQSALDRIRSAALGRDRETFVELMQGARRWFEDEAAAAGLRERARASRPRGAEPLRPPGRGSRHAD